jgi:hypothetical protein
METIMSIFRKPTFILLMFLLILALPALACNLPLPENASPQERQTATAAVRPTVEVIATYEAGVEAENKAVMENPDDKLTFTYSGENQSYHTGLRNRTVFYIDHDLGKVIASESAPFEEAAGCQTARGTDSVSFDGIIAEGVDILGDITIKTDSTATDCEAGTSKVKYIMTGTLSANLVNGQWVGTVTGTATLQQTWEDDLGPNVDDTYPVSWTIIGTSMK